MIFNFLLVILGALMLVGGLIGCVLPVIPGPLLAWAALIIIGLAGGFPFISTWVLVATAASAVLVTVLDGILPARAAGKAGAGKAGIVGSVVGMLAGAIFFPPFGVFAGAFAGALIAEVVFNPENTTPIRSAFAVFRGILLAMILKIAVVGWIGIVFIQTALQLV